MKKYLAILVTLVFAFIGLSGVAATAASVDEACVPSDAWTETVEHPAVTHVQHHEAVTHVVHHEAVTHDVTLPGQRYSWNPKGPEDESDGPGDGSTPLNDPDHWQANTSHYNGTDPLGVVFQQGHGNGGDNASWFFWTVVTETVVDVEAYDEVVVDAEAYDETVVDVEAYTETIEHAAVTCDNPKETSGNIVNVSSTTDYKCGNDFAVVTTIKSTIHWYTFNGHKYYTRALIETTKTTVDHKVVPCPVDNPNGPKHDPKHPHKHHFLPNTGGPNLPLGLAGLFSLLGGIFLVRKPV